jgi:hypothetical protein
MGKPEPPATGHEQSKGDELYEVMLASTAHPRNKNTDREILRRKQNMRDIMKRGSPEDFAAALKACGIEPESAEGREFIAELLKIRGF